MRIPILPYNVDYNCPCVRTVQSWYTIMYNYKSEMYHEARHEHSKIKQYINKTLETLDICVLQYQ